MSRGISSRPERALEVGNEVMTALIKEPVKEAFREVLEEQQTLHVETSGGSGVSDRGLSAGPKLLLLMVALAAIAIYVSRQNGDILEGGEGEGIIGQGVSETIGLGESDEEESTTYGSDDDQEVESEYGSEGEEEGMPGDPAARS